MNEARKAEIRALCVRAADGWLDRTLVVIAREKLAEAVPELLAWGERLEAALLSCAAECHRAKWEFDGTPAFQVLHRIGDSAKAALGEKISDALRNTHWQRAAMPDDEHWEHAADAVLAAIEETHAIVPKKPTEAMIDAGIAADKSADWAAIYKAMIAAAKDG